MHKRMLTVYSIAHAAVDFSCAFLVYRTMLDLTALPLCLLLYNFCAFALQMPFGLICDDKNRNGVFAAIGCVFVSCAFLPVLPAAAASVIAGIGNGLFHVGGGIDVLNDSKNRASALGIFVSPGALGLYFGMSMGQDSTIPTAIPALSLLIFAALILICCRHTYNSFRSKNDPSELTLPKGGVSSLILLTLVVVLRSYVGFNQTFSWKSEWHWGLILTLALVLGKAAGGFLCDLIGARASASLSLGLAAVCYLFSDYPIIGTAAVFLFNMSMPITLFAAARLLSGAKGFAFGLLTFALFLGFLPTWYGLPSLLTEPWAMAAASAVSAVLLFAGLKCERGNREKC